MALESGKRPFMTPVLLGAMLIALALPAVVFFAVYLVQQRAFDETKKEALERQGQRDQMRNELKAQRESKEVRANLEAAAKKVASAICESRGVFRRTWEQQRDNYWTHPSSGAYTLFKQNQEQDESPSRDARLSVLAPKEITEAVTVRAKTTAGLLKFLSDIEVDPNGRLPFFFYIEKLSVTPKERTEDRQQHQMKLTIVVPVKSLSTGS